MKKRNWGVVGVWSGVTSCAWVALAVFGSGALAEEKPAKIQDNSFLLEEAYNQEPGVVQHIQTFQYNTKSKGWDYTFTEEVPVPAQTHQLSFTLPVKHVDGPASLTAVRDVMINYRYQAVDEGAVAFAPRFSVITPTGNRDKGMGTGNFGFQVGLPLSVELSSKLVTHWNVGATLTPNMKNEQGQAATTLGFNYGMSFIHLTTETLNFMVEFVGSVDPEVTGAGETAHSGTFMVNPGVRYAINFASGLQIVPGLSLPISVIGPTKGEVGVLGYLSFEHPLF